MKGKLFVAARSFIDSAHPSSPFVHARARRGSAFDD
jgi:hypothetical protein